MVVDAVRTYLDAASGLTELSRKQAVAAAKTLLRADGQAAPATAENESLPPRVGQSIQTLAGELLRTSQANRAALADLVRAEVERQLEDMDVVPRSEHERLVRRVAELERRLAARHAVERVLAVPGAVDASSVAALQRPAPAAGPAQDGSSAGRDSSAGTADESSEPAAATEGGSSTARSADGSGPSAPAAETGGSGDATEGSGAEDARAEDADGDAPAAEGGAGGTATAAKAKPRTATKAPARAARPRTGTKRATKGKGATKK
ncbi:MULTISPECIES: membrane fusogenic activity family protein [unclassified Nocardiopsis]|uniref:membrane fusogenic activity family protein n=1 Tax=unclassified Nocardiopsis TaxID=2649073 RepID=UPI00135AEACC|nr:MULTISPECIES: membrane fusogenic activity family protein [unclassified Nocardiopsis]